jgi:HD-like signal output (HDOD) protein/CheY-like chemotaxis protein
MKKRILFVGDDQGLFQEFTRESAGAGAPWEAHAALSGEQALAQCESTQFDAVVTASRLEGMTGVALLDALVDQYPKVMRLVLSDLADVQWTMKCIGHAHHHLLQPCAATTLLSALDQAFAQEAWLPSAPVQDLVAQMRQVPSPPKMYFQIVEEIRSPDSSLEKIGALIAQDPAVSAKVMQLANSAVFALQLQIVHPFEAIGYLGLETTKAIVLLAHTYASFDKLKGVGFDINDLWRHSVAVGQLAQRIARMENSGTEMAEQSFAAGLLHDLGKLLLAANLPKLFAQVLDHARAEHCHLWEAEARLMPGAGHAELGATLLGIWGLHRPITEAVALHHSPWRQRERSFSPVTAVHAANVFDHESQPDYNVLIPSQVNMAYLKDLGLADRVDDWRHGCLAAKADA